MSSDANGLRNHFVTKENGSCSSGLHIRRPKSCFQDFNFWKLIQRVFLAPFYLAHNYCHIFSSHTKLACQKKHQYSNINFTTRTTDFSPQRMISFTSINHLSANYNFCSIKLFAGSYFLYFCKYIYVFF